MSNANEKTENSSPVVKGLLLRLIEKYRIFHLKTVQILLAITTPLLLATVLVLGWMYGNKIKEIVTKDFNQQQLVLAQHASRQIENSMDMLKKELILLSLSPSLQYFEKVSIGKRMGITYSSIRESGALEIRFIESMQQQDHVALRYVESLKQQTHILNGNGYSIANTYAEDLLYLKWAGQVQNRESIILGEIIPVVTGKNTQKLMIKIAIPVWQVSVDEAHPDATGRFSGALLFVVDTTSLIQRVTEGIRSGKTGYAWVIDENGLFLYHPEQDFIGKNAFEARKEKKPTISFSRINEIQKDLMLAGKEGTSWYISGWHKGVEGEIKKLIAYTPIHLNEPEKRLWSIAVVAPVREVEDAIQSIHIHQFSLQTLIVVIILLGGITVVSLMFTWSRTLEKEQKTQRRNCRRKYRPDMSE
ncbi:MAG: hypothetical protein HY758_05630 [Nitrospirae bacterium]|nr:hypothetical protein [Nitrospirota bacterium]